MQVELNIGLDIKGQSNSLANCNVRAAQALGFLKELIGPIESRRQLSQYEDNYGVLQLEDSLVVRFELPRAWGVIDVSGVAYVLAQNLEQDCIAVYFHDLDRGNLIGPNAAAWGEFDYNYFNRYDDILPMAFGKAA